LTHGGNIFTVALGGLMRTSNFGFLSAHDAQLGQLDERTDPFRSAVPIDPDQLFRLIPISRSD
jgi:hypothetical protein